MSAVSGLVQAIQALDALDNVVMARTKDITTDVSAELAVATRLAAEMGEASARFAPGINQLLRVIDEMITNPADENSGERWDQFDLMHDRVVAALEGAVINTFTTKNLRSFGPEYNPVTGLCCGQRMTPPSKFTLGRHTFAKVAPKTDAEMDAYKALEDKLLSAKMAHTSAGGYVAHITTIESNIAKAQGHVEELRKGYEEKMAQVAQLHREFFADAAKLPDLGPVVPRELSAAETAEISALLGKVRQIINQKPPGVAVTDDAYDAHEKYEVSVDPYEDGDSGDSDDGANNSSSDDSHSEQDGAEQPADM